MQDETFDLTSWTPRTELGRKVKAGEIKHIDEILGAGKLILEPEIIDVIKGGTHTAGRIQYAYNLYRLNALQTKLSPLSRMVSLTKGEGAGGGNLNEVVASIPVVRISDIDLNYTHIKVYCCICYTAL